MSNLEKDFFAFRINKQPKTELPPLDMYEISGQEPITEHALNRYIKDKKQDALIEKEAEKSTSFFTNQLSNANIKEATELIKKGMEGPNLKIQQLCASNIDHYLIPEGELLALQKLLVLKIRENLSSPNIENQKMGMKMIYKAPGEEQASLLREGLLIANIEVLDAGISNITWVSGDRAEIKDMEEIITTNVKKWLINPDIKIQKMAADMIDYIPTDKRESLRRIVELDIKQGLKSQDIKIQKIAAGMIYESHESGRDELRKILEKKIRENLNNPDINTQGVAIDLIYYTDYPNTLNLEKLVMEKIKRNLESDDVRTQKEAVELFASITKILVSDAQMSEVTDLIIKKGLGEKLIEPPLYKYKDLNNTNFSRKKFEKTGSEIDLLGGELKDKTIIRRIEPAAFLAWQKLFENHKLWQKRGFNHLPIESIQSYKLGKNGMVDVYTGVLDLSLASWRTKSKMFSDKLEKEMNKINDVLKETKISHGHPHENNYCLRFFRDENGKPDFSKTPLLYLIDFDQSNSSSN